jgi:hypothetical protein
LPHDLRTMHRQLGHTRCFHGPANVCNPVLTVDCVRRRQCCRGTQRQRHCPICRLDEPQQLDQQRT